MAQPTGHVFIGPKPKNLYVGPQMARPYLISHIGLVGSSRASPG